jgi:hypothetical protein
MIRVRAASLRPERLAIRKLWLIPFGLATAVALAMTAQAYYASAGTERSLSFILQGHLIRWYAWALLTPLLIGAFRRGNLDRKSSLHRVLFYSGIGLLSVLAWAGLTGLGIGWWWSFPRLVPENPLWHAQFELEHKSVLGFFVYALIVLSARGQRVLSAMPSRSSVPGPASPAVPAVALRTPERVLFLAPEQIEWLEADRDHVVVHGRTGPHRVREHLSAFEARLPRDQFLRVSRSAIVNVRAIAELQPWFRGNFILILRGGAKIQTGKTYRKRITSLIR